MESVEVSNSRSRPNSGVAQLQGNEAQLVVRGIGGALRGPKSVNVKGEGTTSKLGAVSVENGCCPFKTCV